MIGEKHGESKNWGYVRSKLLIPFVVFKILTRLIKKEMMDGIKNTIKRYSGGIKGSIEFATV